MSFFSWQRQYREEEINAPKKRFDYGLHVIAELDISVGPKCKQKTQDEKVTITYNIHRVSCYTSQWLQYKCFQHDKWWF